ncbi:MAG: methyltransferase domain-containing protein [bacterium]|nr:methyltransferase domain-containing protein [bacterium]
MSAPTADELEIQGAWDPVPLREQWPMGRDNHFIMDRLMRVPVEQTLLGASGKVLEVAAAEAVHSCRLAAQGLECHVLEPSEGMLLKAREHMGEFGVDLHLVRGIAEALPYPDHTFDRVLIDSAMDHLAAPDTGLREMIRVLKPDGRFVVSFVNYGSLAVRLSRAVYRLERTVSPRALEEKRFWDTPVPYEHTFECTYKNIGRLCGQYLEFERAVGVSMLWGTPGWSRFLERLHWNRAMKTLDTLDKVARRMPGLADFVLMVWRPRTGDDTIGLGLRTMPPLARVTAARPALPPRRVETMRVTPADPIYQRRTREDLEWEASWGYAPIVAARIRAAKPWANRALTGDAARSWLDDMAARGPFERALLVGGEDEDEAETWLRAGGSESLHVVDSSPARIARLRTRLAARAHRVRFLQQDLNFLELHRRHYDVVLLAGGLSRVLNLEFVLDEVALALRPGGLLGIGCYVGERRQAYAPARLALVGQALREIPERFRHGTTAIEASDPEQIAPFRAARSDEIVAAARARFDVVQETYAGRLFPLLVHLDVAAIEREAPELLERLHAREQALASDPAATPCSAYLVLRKRG